MAGVRSWKQRLSSALLITALISSVMVVAEAPAMALDVVVDDFESGVAPGDPCPPSAPPLGFCTFSGAGSSVAISDPSTPPAPERAGATTSNRVLQMDVDVSSFAGFIHGFTDGEGNWVNQDWSTRAGISFWLYGSNSGTTLFIDILENRNPGSSTDDAERWSVAFVDDFNGWQLIELPFSSFTFKEVGNGAPNDGRFDRFDIHGWALGALGTDGPQTYYVDDVGLYGEVEPPALSVGFGAPNFDVAEGSTGDVTVALSRPMNDTDPAEVSVDYAVEELTPIPGREYTPTAGTLTFVNGGDQELTFAFETFDDGKYEPDERVILRLSNAIDVELGAAQASVTIVDDDPFDPLLYDDFELFPYLWEAGEDLTISNPELASNDPMAIPGQGAFERVLQVDVVEDMVTERVIDDLATAAEAGNKQTTKQIEDAIKRLEESLDPGYWINENLLHPEDGKHVFDRQAQGVSELRKVVDSGGPQTAAAQDAIDQIVALAADIASFSVELAEANGASAKDLDKALEELLAAAEDVGADRPGQAIRHHRNAWMTATAALALDDADLYGLIIPSLGAISRDFPIGQDWSSSESLSFWYYGQNSGDEITFELLDNRAPDPGPSGWSLVWSDEFNDSAGTPPNPDNWGYENGDGTVNGIPGWGNSELQYYTDSPDNVAIDGDGNLVITAQEADGELCYYGPCEYTSARLVSKNRAEFAYGRLESRIQVPVGEDGLWPAFWSLGTDIDLVEWPQTGEIDIMEYVSRLPDEIFGTIHGPGYSGGGAFGNIYDEFGEPVANDYHTFAIEWQPDVIEWYVDDILYHTATPADVPGEWVFNDPVYLLLNLALGGNFGGPLSPDLTFPQEMKVDYVRAYQAPDTAERFEALFIDDFEGWQQIEIPFASLDRSDTQPEGAPDDGLGLSEVWGYGFSVPGSSSLDTLWLDQIHLVDTTPPTVAITDDVEAEFATGDVTFTFTFSENVGTSFAAEDIALTGGVVGAFDRVDGRTATLVARPPIDSSGVLEVSVAAGSFSDLAGNPNAVDASASQAYDTPPAPGGPVVIDDFEGPLGWGFFGGDAAGGGGEVLSDRPKEGLSYFSTGWGGAPESGGFYGGAFRNFDNTAQVAPPADPWLNVWVLNQSSATADQYTLEVTIREDLAGDGWDGFGNANGDESFRLDTVYPSSSFDDQWTLLSAPLSDFNLVDGTGGNNTFDGDLDEIVIVIAGVQPPGGSSVEVDFDYFAFTSGGPLEGPPPPPPGSGLEITFDESPPAQLEPFEGLGGSVVSEPGDPSNNVASLTKPSTAQPWAGTLVYTQDTPAFSIPQIAFAAGSTTVTLRFWTERPAGIPVMLKVENSGDAGQFKEVTVNTTTSGEWETLTFDFVGLDTSLVWDKVAVFPDFFTPEHPGGDYYVDDITFP